MSEKQLNFFHIFDHPDKRDELEADYRTDDFTDNGEESLSSDPVEENLQEEKDRLRAEEISADQIKSEEQIAKKERYQRLLQLPVADISEFQEFIADIQNYSERIGQFRQALAQASPGPEKEVIYRKIVNPDLYDEDKYHDLARLYLNYLVALQNERYYQSKASSTYPKNEKKKNKIKDSKSIKKPEIKLSENSRLEEEDENNDAPDPYGDIYPMSRHWRKK